MNQRSFAGETAALREYWDLRRDPVFRGRGIPRGDGRPVLVLPGLFSNDIYLTPLRDWLRRIGYRPVASSLVLNAGCGERLSARVERALGQALRRDARRVAVIGHSRGGLIGKVIATRLGDRCTHFVALGSPVGAVFRAGAAALAVLGRNRGDASRESIAAHPVAAASRAVTRWLDPDCDPPACGCSYVRDLLAPLSAETKVCAIYSPDDPVVPPDACTIPGAENIAVPGTHSGLVFNKAVYAHLARTLAEPLRA
jgi:triacylglycerol lipase